MKKKILVVDDDQGILDAFCLMLEEDGYEVETSSDADVIDGLTKKTAPDLILLDVLLSGADGRQVCKKLKSRQDLKHIPVIMVSAHMGIEESVKNAHADGFLMKPFEMDDLLNTVKQHIK